MIDDHVHFREPGYTAKADIASESRAAVAGGVTSFIEMPNTDPPTLTHALLEDKYAIAARTSVANYAFYFGASNDNLDAIRALDPRTVPGVKVFLCESTGNLCVSDPAALDGVFRDSPVLVAVHCEDDRIVHANIDRAKAQYGDAIPMACIRKSVRAGPVSIRQNGPSKLRAVTARACTCCTFPPRTN